MESNSVSIILYTVHYFSEFCQLRLPKICILAQTCHNYCRLIQTARGGKIRAKKSCNVFQPLVESCSYTLRKMMIRLYWADNSRHSVKFYCCFSPTD